MLLRKGKEARFPFSICRSFPRCKNNLTGDVRNPTSPDDGNKEAAQPIIRFKLFALSSGAANCSGIQPGRILLFAVSFLLLCGSFVSLFFSRYLFFSPVPAFLFILSISAPLFSLADLPSAFSRSSFRYAAVAHVSLPQ